MPELGMVLDLGEHRDYYREFNQNILINQKTFKLMEKTKEELVRQYVENRKEIERLNKESREILTQCKSFFGHQVGEIAVYKEIGRKNRVASLWRPHYEALTDKEIRCVLMYVQPLIDIFDNELHFKATFHPIKKDGHVSQNSCYVKTDEVEWTGEIHEDFKNN